LVDELIEVRRSRRVRRWTLTVPWGDPPVLTVPAWMPEGDVERVVESHREWIAAERAKQRPRLRLDPREVSEVDARRAARELVTMLADEEAQELGVAFNRIEIRDQRTRWGSCSSRGTLSFNWRLVLAPLEVAEYVVVHELCHLREPNHSPRFWQFVAAARPDYPQERRWLAQHGWELQAYVPA
jgi:predicted metal-dependent hydrolase